MIINLGLCLIVLLFSVDMANSAFTMLYVGSFTSNEISAYIVEKSSLLLRSTVVAGYTPTWMTYNQNVLYTTNEQSGYVASLAVNTDGTLTYEEKVSSSGSSPTFITLSPINDYLLIANYDTGSDVVIAIKGIQFGLTVDFQQHNGTGPVPGRQTGPHAHQIVFDISQKFVYSPDLGADKIYQYRFNPNNGKLLPLAVPYAYSAAGDGPRHLAFHPNGLYAYLSCELSSAVIVYRIDVSGELKQIQKILTVPDRFILDNYPAEILVYPGGNFVYVTNRGNDSISIFKVNTTEGTLTLLNIHPVGGSYPRGMVLDSATNILFLMNQNSNTVTAHSVNTVTGELTYLGVAISNLETPVCGQIVHF